MKKYSTRPKELDTDSLAFQSVTAGSIIVGYSPWNNGLVLQLPHGRTKDKRQISQRFKILSVGNLHPKYSDLAELVGTEVDVQTVHDHLSITKSMIFLGKCFIPLEKLTNEERVLVGTFQ